MKWHPGHYVQVRGGGNYCGTECDTARRGQDSVILNNANVQGISVWIFWKYLESDAGNDFTAGFAWLDREIAYLKANYPGKRLMLTFFTSYYKPYNNGSGIFPQYFIDAGCPASEMGNGTVFKMGDQTCRGYLKRMLAAYGARYDSEAILEAIRIDQETDYSYYDPAGQGWDAATVDNGWKDAALAARNAFPTTNVVIPLNWPENYTTQGMEALFQYYKSIHVAIGGPDTMPISGAAIAYPCPSLGVPCMTNGLAGAGSTGHNYCGEIAFMPSVETSELGYYSVAPGDMTSAQVVASWNNDYCASHGIWDFNMEIGDPPTHYWNGASGELATINANPQLMHNAKPAGYP
jgi:hypothetical protein